jgi:hypothetical protein
MSIPVQNTSSELAASLTPVSPVLKNQQGEGRQIGDRDFARYGVYYIYHKMEGKIEVVEEKRYPNKKVASKQKGTELSTCR